jgi:hypothetical protein
MSPSRTAYRSPRRRREVFLAVVGVLAVLAFTGVMLWVLSPGSDEPAPVPPIATTLPPGASSSVPGSTPDSSSASSTAPATSAPAGSTTSSSAPPG